jgi:hypothetical protein
LTLKDKVLMELQEILEQQELVVPKEMVVPEVLEVLEVPEVLVELAIQETLVMAEAEEGEQYLEILANQLQLAVLAEVAAAGPISQAKGVVVVVLLEVVEIQDLQIQETPDNLDLRDNRVVQEMLDNQEILEPQEM